MKPLHKKGDVVTIFQMDTRKGLFIEGRATIVKPLGSDDWPDEYYKVRFHDKNDKPSLGEEYDRFVDRDGQDDPDKYIQDFNRRLGITTTLTVHEGDFGRYSVPLRSMTGQGETVCIVFAGSIKAAGPTAIEKIKDKYRRHQGIETDWKVNGDIRED